mgnify:CR=1 FL=1
MWTVNPELKRAEAPQQTTILEMVTGEVADFLR